MPPAALSIRGVAAVFGFLGFGVAVSPLAAGTCAVPGTHPSIAVAAADAGCTAIQLGAQLYPESVVFDRALTVTGLGPASTVVRGQFRAGSGGDVVLAALRVESGCDPVLQATAGGRIEGVSIETVRNTALACPLPALFIDGFETGGSGRWSASAP